MQDVSTLHKHSHNHVVDTERQAISASSKLYVQLLHPREPGPPSCFRPLYFDVSPSAFVMTSRQWVILRGITQNCPFLLREKINLWKVGRRWSEVPPPTLTKKKKQKKKQRQRSPWIQWILPSNFLLQSHKHVGTQARAHTHTHTCKHKHTRAETGLAPTQIYFLSLSLTHTHTHTNTNTRWEALQSARLNVQPRCCAELMKSGCHASAWQVSLTKQIPIYMQRGRRGPCQMLMPGTL